MQPQGGRSCSDVVDKVLAGDQKASPGLWHTAASDSDLLEPANYICLPRLHLHSRTTSTQQARTIVRTLHWMSHTTLYSAMEAQFFLDFLLVCIKQLLDHNDAQSAAIILQASSPARRVTHRCPVVGPRIASAASNADADCQATHQ